MTLSRLTLYDTTLRDGQQTQGVQFSAAEKAEIARMLDTLGVDYIEGGWPGANPTDSDFFAAAPKTRATMTAFGMMAFIVRCSLPLCVRWHSSTNTNSSPTVRSGPASSSLTKPPKSSTSRLPNLWTSEHNRRGVALPS